ncbi:MAG: hypothetical protein ACLFR2_09225 [Candidatus Kapaibacterium sp.]
MENNNNKKKPVLIRPENKNKSHWYIAPVSEIKTDTAELSHVVTKIRTLDSEISGLNRRIHNEINLTDKIAQRIKNQQDGKQSDPGRTSELEMQWETAENNIEVFKGLIEKKKKEKNTYKAEYKKKFIEARLNAEKKAAADMAELLPEALEAVELAIEKINRVFPPHKSLVYLFKKDGEKSRFEDIYPDPVDITDVFGDAIRKYLFGLKEKIDELEIPENPKK